MFSATTKEAANVTKDFAANDIENAAQNVKRDVRDGVEDATNNFYNYANQAGRKVRGLIDSASNEFSHVSEKVTGEVRSNPVRSSLIALGAGYIIASLFRR